MSKKNNLIWVVFYFLLLLIFLNIVGSLFGLHLEIEKNSAYKLLFLGLPVILLILHSLLTLSALRATFFIVLAAFTGWIMEVWGLSAGTFFGGHYVYKTNQLALLNVPLSVILYWAVFIYTGYCVVNSFIYWLDKQKPSQNQKNLWLLPIAVLIDGWVVVTIDLFMDPLQVQSGSWRWLEGGPYFGVPIGNFIGWFLVTTIVTGVFRTYEYFFSIKEAKYDRAVYIIPVICYAALAISFAFDAIKHQMQGLAVIGSVLMLPIAIFNVILFIRWKKKATAGLALK
ncbi:MAG TPA: carotenoid biosynthesis protein [Candidatus Bathyarchaeia archaeon]|nr:carotenoid biosynthesis protein [Candidatus Bathyarchaeia archaeon]